MELIVSYIGSPVIGSKVGLGKAATTPELDGLIRAFQGRGGINSIRTAVD